MKHTQAAPAITALLVLCALTGCDEPQDADALTEHTEDTEDTDNAQSDDESAGDEPNLDEFEAPDDGTVVLGETVVMGPEGPMTVTYENIDGIGFVDGDIELGPVQLLRTPIEFEDSLGIDEDTDVQHAFTPLPVWGNSWLNGTVYYVAPATTSAVVDASINSAIAAMDAQTDLTFVAIPPLFSNFVDHIYFTSSFTNAAGTGSSDSIGRKGGRQYVRFSFWDVFSDTPLGQGLVHHELGHAVGLYHEHQRVDRDSFVIVVGICIQPGKASNFEKRIGFAVGPYDTNSVMHYFDNTFSIGGGCKTLISKSGGTLGGSELTANDIAGLNWIAGL